MEIELSRILNVLKRKWMVLVAMPILTGLIALTVGLLLPKSYSASSQLFVSPSLTGSTVISRDSQTLNTLVTSGPVLDRVIRELELDLTREELEKKVHSEVLAGNQIIEITVKDSDPQMAADISNSVSVNFQSQVTDLTLGEFQRNLDNLVFQSNALQSQIIVLDSRIASRDTPENADDGNIQAEIRELQSQRITLLQTKADIDANIRGINSQLSMSTSPVVGTDVAHPPTRSDSPSPILLGALGAFLGGLVSFVIVFATAMLDNMLREPSQVVSLPVLGVSNTRKLSDTRLTILSAHLPKSGSVVLIAARASELPREIADSLVSKDSSLDPQISAGAGLLDDPQVIEMVAQAAGVVIVAEKDKSTIGDLEEVDDLLRSIGTQIVGTYVMAGS